jgi:hypothetical protein
VDSLSNIIPSNKGWEINICNENLFEKLQDTSFGWEANVVTVLGKYNTGKTFLLDLLMQTSLRSNNAINKGLSLKFINTDQRKLVLVDTVGMDHPIKGMDNVFLFISYNE